MFFVNGGLIGFTCYHAWAPSLTVSMPVHIFVSSARFILQCQSWTYTQIELVMPESLGEICTQNSIITSLEFVLPEGNQYISCHALYRISYANTNCRTITLHMLISLIDFSITILLIWIQNNKWWKLFVVINTWIFSRIKGLLNFIQIVRLCQFKFISHVLLRIFGVQEWEHRRTHHMSREITNTCSVENFKILVQREPQSPIMVPFNPYLTTFLLTQIELI